MSLQVAERLYVLTPGGEREIQLCIGDITSLSVQDHVDVLFISALPGDYSKTKSSLIGSLYYKLGVDVFALSYNKKEDLRKKFHCWISHKLPATLPFKQIICAEKDRKTSSIDEVVTNMFRALMPVFNTENKRVVTSLLGTGSQTANRKSVLELMVKTAVEWMHIGLPLELFKIVVYSKTPTTLTETDKECIAAFKKLKKKLNLSVHKTKDPPISNDIFMINATDDQNLCEEIKLQLRQLHKNIKIITPGQVVTKPASWQHDMHTTMMSCARVVPVLSKAFLNSEECVDLYNVAMCCNRLLHRSVLTPICIDKINDLPAYMAMVQWYKCSGNDKSSEIAEASEDLVEQIQRATAPKKKKYDVFISYSHKNTDTAKILLQELRKKDSSLQIFFDYEELKTGMSWQQSLYTAMENSYCVITLISKAYLQSSVCNEEYNIAMTRYFTKRHKVRFLAVYLDVDSHLLESNLGIEEIKGENINKIIEETCQAVFRSTKVPKEVEDGIEKLEELFRKERQSLFEKHYSLVNEQFEIINSSSEIITKNQNTPNITITCSFTAQNYRYLNFIKAYLAVKIQSVKFILNTASKSETDSLFYFIGLSNMYFQSKKQVEELHVILSKFRQNPNVKVYAIWLDQLKKGPLYARLIPAFTYFTDAWWSECVDVDGLLQDLESDLFKCKAQVEREYGAFQDSELVALLKCACDLQHLSTGRDLPGTVRTTGVLRGPYIKQEPETGDGISNKNNTEDVTKTDEKITSVTDISNKNTETVESGDFNCDGKESGKAGTDKNSVQNMSKQNDITLKKSSSCILL